MPSSLPPDPRHTQLRTWYDHLTARIARLNTDIGRELDSERRFVLEERRADLVADRELVASYLEALEHNQLLLGPWPPDFKTTDLLAAPPPRILFKAGRHDFYRHIPLPPNYIPRPELLAEVRERLLAGTGGLALTSAIQFKQADVLHGMGGIGKSVLARALCDDPEVQAAFPDGILWATLGQTPDLTARLREWIETLGGIVGQTAPTLDQLRNTLAEALRDKACLLIVDDAWRKAHLEPFCAGGAAGRLLITTRDAALAEGLDAGVYPVPVMAPDQAVALLEEWAAGSLAEVGAEVKAKIVRRLGCLPLAVRLAGAQLRQKDPAEWLANFDARKLKTRRVETVHDSLEATFALSMDTLAPPDRRLYVALAIFREDEATPVVAIAKLWSVLDGRNADETTELLDDLAARALLARGHADGDAVTVHDLLRDFMVAELGEEGLIATHRALLDAYRRTRQGAGWHATSDDGYLYDHLAYHLDQLAGHDAAAEGELHGLFADHAWLHARVSRPGYLYDGYLDDLDIAWRRANVAADRQIETDGEPSNLANCIRYALIHTSINSLSLNAKPQLIAGCLAAGVWSVEKAISMARRVPEPGHRLASYQAILEWVRLARDQALDISTEALAVAKSIKPMTDRAKALAGLVSQLSGPAKVEAIQEALASANAIRRSGSDSIVVNQMESLSESGKANALIALVPHLTGETRYTVLRQALHSVLAMVHPSVGNDKMLAEVGPIKLEKLAPVLTDALVREALESVVCLGDEWQRMRALVALAPSLSRDLFRDALPNILSMKEAEPRVLALAALGKHLARDLMHETLSTAMSIEREENRALAIRMLAPYLQAEELRQAHAVSSAFLGHSTRAQTLAALALSMPDETRAEFFREARTAASAIGDLESRATTLARVALQLSDEARTEWVSNAIDAAVAIQDGGRRGRMLLDLAVSFTGHFKARALSEARAATRMIRDEQSRLELLLKLASLTMDETKATLLIEPLKAALTLHDEAQQARALTSLAAQLVGEAKAQAIQAALCAATAAPSEENRGELLADLAPHLHRRLLKRASRATSAIGDARVRARTLTALATRATGEDKVRIACEALAASLSVRSDADRASLLLDLVPHLVGEILAEALREARTAALSVKDAFHKTQLLHRLAQHLTGENRATALDEALAAALVEEDDSLRTSALLDLTPSLAAESKVDALLQVRTAILATSDREKRVTSLIHLSSNLAGEARIEVLVKALGEALAAAWDDRQDEDSRHEEAAAWLWSHDWEPSPRRQSLDLSLALGKLLTALEPCLIDQHHQRLFEAALTSDSLIQRSFEAALLPRSFRFQRKRPADLASEIACYLNNESLQQALETALTSRSLMVRANTLTVLSPYCKGLAIIEVTEALFPTYDWYSAILLAALVSQPTHKKLTLFFQDTLANIQSPELIDLVRDSVLVDLAGRLARESPTDALTAVLAINENEVRADTLKALVSHLKDKNRQRAFLAALADLDLAQKERLHMSDELLAQMPSNLFSTDDEKREAYLWAISPTAQPQQPIINANRRSLATHVQQELRDKARSDVLRFIANEKLLKPPILSPTTLAAIARHIIEICQEWEWL